MLPMMIYTHYAKVLLTQWNLLRMIALAVTYMKTWMKVNMRLDTMIEFFVAIQPPTVTHQEKKVTVVKGKPVFYEPPELADARQKLTAYLARHTPNEKLTGPIQLITKWCYPKGKHKNGEYKTTKPDTDNMIKLLKDVMTELGYWRDDALVASEITEKFWADIPGIYIRVKRL
ncbi:MAG: endodeoxyribonuclease RusA [Sporomusa sp.]|nr:endodeoxyribonuclease RusA [Sporomusa sp.]